MKCDNCEKHMNDCHCKEVAEIVEYLKKTTQENTSNGQFHQDMEKYSLEAILEAFEIHKQEG